MNNRESTIPISALKALACQSLMAAHTISTPARGF